MKKTIYMCDYCKKELGEVRVTKDEKTLCVTCFMGSNLRFDESLVQWRGMVDPDVWITIVNPYTKKGR